MKKLLLTLLAINIAVLCAEAQGFSLSGFITRESGEPVPEVTVQLTGSVMANTTTDTAGFYEFVNIPPGSDLTITPARDNNHRECVSVRDMLFTGKHIFGTSLLMTPQAVVAADANNSQGINTADLVQMQNLILGTTSSFSDNTSWRFVSEDYLFPNPVNPFVEAFPESVSINNLQADETVDFTGIKIGDPTDCVEDAPQQPLVSLNAPGISASAGEQITVDITADDFDEVSGLQFSLDWDTEVITLDEVVSSALPNFNSQSVFTEPGQLSLCWMSNTLDGVTLNSGAKVLSLQFTVVAQTPDNTAIAFVDTPTPMEAVDNLCEAYAINTSNGIVSANDEEIDFAKIYGDTARNTPTKVKAFPSHNGLYVAATRLEGGVKHATFSKFNRFTGELEWDLKLDEGSIIHDFEFVPSTQECLLVGATEPFQVNGIAQDNESLLIKVDDEGQIVFGHKYQQTGREHFNRIIRHPDPRKPGFPYYIVGTINPPENPPFYPAPPSATDRVIVLNINENGAVLWASEYDYAGTTVPDDEFHRGLFAVNIFDGGFPNNGDIIITGNDSPTNDGILVKIHGETGAVLDAFKFPTGYDIYDGVEQYSSQIILAGTDFVNNEAVLGRLTNQFEPLQGLRFSDISTFREVGLDIQARMYATGTGNSAAPAINHNYMCRIVFSSGLMQADYARRLVHDEFEYEAPKFMTNFNFEQIFYADSRLQAPNTNDWDLLVGAFDLDFSSSCQEEITPAVSDFTLDPQPILVTTAPHSLPTPSPIGQVSIGYLCAEFCSQDTCGLSFTWNVLECGEVQFTSQISSPVPAVNYTWDVDCDGEPESALANPLIEFDPCGGTYPVCLTVEYADGSTCTYEETITVPGDDMPPIVVNFDDITVIGITDGEGGCSALVNIGVPIVSDNCTRVGITNNITGSVDATAIYPEGTTTVIYTISDECGNTVTLTFDVTVVCRNCGEAVITCFPDFVNGNPNAGVQPTNPVLGIVDIRSYGNYPVGGYISEQSGDNIYNPDHWNYSNLGLVFGLAIDNENNIYAASTTVFGCEFIVPGGVQSAFGPSGNARIYKIDPFDQITTFIEQGVYTQGGANIPSDGAGYGNICYDSDHHQLFATNLHDGYIYRIDLADGSVAERFDPFLLGNAASPDNPDFAALNQRPWGIAYNSCDGRLYYSRWVEDRGRINDTENNQIWSVQINEDGSFEEGAEDEMVIILPDHIDTYSTILNYSNPVSDIAFSQEGVMLVAERSMRQDCGDATQTEGNWFEWYSHQSRVLEYQFNGVEWKLTPEHGIDMPPFTDYATQLKYQIGHNHPSEGATTSGGIDYGYNSFDPANGSPSVCDSMVWATGDLIGCSNMGSQAVYGIQGISNAGGNTCDGYTIDFDGVLNTGNKVQQGDVEIFKCLNCPKPDTCSVAFTWEPLECNTAQFTAQPVGNILIGTYSWDVGCDGIVESTEANPILELEDCGMATPVCLTVEYLDGEICSYEESIALPPDEMPPAIDCPNSFTVTTDPGVCVYTVDFEVPVSDNCDNNPTLDYMWTDGSGPDLPEQLAEGTTGITVTATDLCGNQSLPCSFQLTVVDEEPPQLQCPPTATTTVLGCSDGAFVDYADAAGSDNCELASIEYSISSGSYFPCGTTAVTVIATDIFGNQSDCDFNVNVNGCQRCGEICGAIVECGVEAGLYEFTICTSNFTTVPDEDAIINVSSSSGLVTLVDNTLPGLSGTLEVQPPLPANLTFTVSFEFPCEFGDISCVDSITVTTPCCEEIFVDDQAVCNQAEMLSIPLQGDLDYLTGVDYIKWYIAPHPCDNYVLVYQSQGIADLPFNPSLYAELDSACVFAEIVFLPGNPCSSLLSDTATIYLCELQNGELFNPNGPFCSDALPDVYQPITFVSEEHPACTYTIEWRLDGELVEGENNDTYVPTGLSYTGGPDDCYSEHLVSAHVTTLCGTVNYGKFIRIYNAEAPAGDLYLDPFEPMPFCPGEDATVRYDAACIDTDPDGWAWSVSEDGENYEPLEGAGNTNPVWNTNPLDVDTWYQVNKQNGACPEESISFMIDIRDELELISFNAEREDDCNDSPVELTLEFSPEPDDNCDILVRWYKDGELLGTTFPDFSPAEFIYFDMPSAGNYYAEVVSVCCEESVGSEVITLGPGMEVGLAVPCFRCNDEEVVLQGLVENPPEGASCTYQWYINGNEIPDSDNLTLTIDEAFDDEMEQGGATFTFEASCGDCVRDVAYFLLQCGSPIISTFFPNRDITVTAMPNPTADELQVNIEGLSNKVSAIQLIDQWGRVLSNTPLESVRENYALLMGHLPNAVYFLQVYEAGELVWVEKIVKQ